MQHATQAYSMRPLNVPASARVLTNLAVVCVVYACTQATPQSSETTVQQRCVAQGIAIDTAVAGQQARSALMSEPNAPQLTVIP